MGLWGVGWWGKEVDVFAIFLGFYRSSRLLWTTGSCKALEAVVEFMAIFFPGQILGRS